MAGSLTKKEKGILEKYGIDEETLKKILLGEGNNQGKVEVDAMLLSKLGSIEKDIDNMSKKVENASISSNPIDENSLKSLKDLVEKLEKIKEDGVLTITVAQMDELKKAITQNNENGKVSIDTTQISEELSKKLTQIVQTNEFATTVNNVVNSAIKNNLTPEMINHLSDDIKLHIDEKFNSLEGQLSTKGVGGAQVQKTKKNLGLIIATAGLSAALVVSLFGNWHFKKEADKYFNEKTEANAQYSQIVFDYNTLKESFDSTIDSLNEAIGALKNSGKVDSETLASIEKEVREINDKISSGSYVSYEEYEKIEKQLDDAKKQIEDLKKQNADLQTENASLKTDNIDLQKKLDDANNTIVEKDKIIAEKENIITEKDKTIEELKQEIEELKSNPDLQPIVDDLKAQLKTAISERDAAIKERDAAIKDRDAAIKDRDAAISDRDAAIKDRDAAKEEKDAANAKYAQLENAINGFYQQYVGTSSDDALAKLNAIIDHFLTSGNTNLRNFLINDVLCELTGNSANYFNNMTDSQIANYVKYCIGESSETKEESTEAKKESTSTQVVEEEGELKEDPDSPVKE